MNAVSALFTPQGVASAAFVLVMAITVLGALIAVAARNIFHNVLGLALSLMGVAGLFLYLNSPFVAMMEILIYVGPSALPSALPSCCPSPCICPSPPVIP